MLGLQIDDPHGMESGGSEKGLGMLPMTTVLEGDKRLVRKDYHCLLYTSPSPRD